MKYQQIREILKTKTIGIAGAGGLGSNCAIALSRIGIGKLVICDFDKVSISNLNRQYYFSNQIGIKKVIALRDNIKPINSEIEIEIYNIKLYPEKIVAIYKNCDLIIEAFDYAQTKQMIIETVGTFMPKIPLIVGSGMAGFGNNNAIEEKKIENNLYVCGDGISEISDEMPPLAPRLGIVANMQANLAVEILLKRK